MGERRVNPRRRILQRGIITFGLDAGIDCTVRNVSNDGAALEVASPVGIPDEFILLIGKDSAKRSCRVMWRTARRIGVSFF